MRHRCGMGREGNGSEFLINIAATWEQEERISKLYKEAIFKYNRSVWSPTHESKMELEISVALDSRSSSEKVLQIEVQESNKTYSKEVNDYQGGVVNEVNQIQKMENGVPESTAREKLFECSDCHLKFTTRGSLNSHKRTNCKYMSKTCEYCTEAFPTMGKLIKHRNDCEKVLKMYYGKDFKSMKSYLVQMREESSHTLKDSDDQYPVSEDGTVTSREDSTMQSDEKSYKCSYCTKEFTSSRSKSVHEHTHRPFGCPKCDERFSEERFLTVHTRFHCRKLPYECQYCTERFPTMGQLIKHRIRCNSGKVEEADAVGANYFCDLCGKGFKSKKTMLAHMQKHTEDKKDQGNAKDYHKNPESKECENRTNSDENGSILTRVLQSPTSHVSEGFIGKEALESHVINHQYTQPSMYTAGYAAYHYGDKLDNGVHQVNERPGEVVYIYSPVMSYIPKEMAAQQEPPTKAKSFSCTLCGKGFTSAWGKTVHERSHSGAKPYECSRCHKHFTQKSSLTVHQRLHCSHNKGELQCLHCREKFRTMGQMINHRSSCAATRDGVYGEDLESVNPTMVRTVEYDDNAARDTGREDQDNRLISVNYDKGTYDGATGYYQICNYDSENHLKNNHNHEINSNHNDLHNCTNIEEEISCSNNSDFNHESNGCSDNRSQRSTHNNFFNDNNNNVIVSKTIFPSIQLGKQAVVGKYNECAYMEKPQGEMRIYAPTAALPTAVPVAITTITTTATSQVTSRREKPIKIPSVTTKAETVPKAMPYSCPSCDETFLYKAALQTHEKKVHSNILRCFKCQTGFMRTEDFADHVKMGCAFKRGGTSSRKNLET